MNVSGEEDGNEDGNNLPHAVPAVTDYHPNKNAGQPIRMEPRTSPQEYPTGRLADDACFQLADFINSVGLTSSERDTFFKLELVSSLLEGDLQYLLPHRINIFHGKTTASSWKISTVYPLSLKCMNTGFLSVKAVCKRSSSVAKISTRSYSSLSAIHASNITSIMYLVNTIRTSHARSVCMMRHVLETGVGGCRYNSSVGTGGRNVLTTSLVSN